MIVNIKNSTFSIAFGYRKRRSQAAGKVLKCFYLQQIGQVKSEELIENKTCR